uniref:Uncharacterized protein n=1 Tax=Setaria viridis TaxID=4556 RepID=A0A4U6SYD5_SETVI|nr:hypothetical protein SEVIR_9G232433v2 [Setaria viridis]
MKQALGDRMLQGSTSDKNKFAKMDKENLECQRKTDVAEKESKSAAEECRQHEDSIHFESEPVKDTQIQGEEAACDAAKTTQTKKNEDNIDNQIGQQKFILSQHQQPAEIDEIEKEVVVGQEIVTKESFIPALKHNMTVPVPKALLQHPLPSQPATRGSKKAKGKGGREQTTNCNELLISHNKEGCLTEPVTPRPKLQIQHLQAKKTRMARVHLSPKERVKGLPTGQKLPSQYKNKLLNF